MFGEPFSESKSKTTEGDETMATAVALKEGTKQSADTGAIRPFNHHVPEAELAELRKRVQATKWPERETVADATQGVQLATVQALARYWATEYDWRKIEAKLNALPQFITQIDGLDIHFIHVRSKHKNALPLIVTHGWPSIRSKGLSRHKTPVRCVSTANLARGVEDQSSGLNHAASPKRVWPNASPTIDTVFNGRP